MSFKKKLLTSLFATLFFTTNTFAQVNSGAETQKVMQPIMQEVMMEVQKDAAAGKQPDPQAVADKIISLMKKNVDSFRKAAEKDCVTEFGDKSKKNCSCLAEKTDYDKQFELTQKMMSSMGDMSEVKPVLEKMLDDAEAVLKACKFDNKVIKERIGQARKAISG